MHAPGVLPTRAPLATARARGWVRERGMGTGWVGGGVYRGTTQLPGETSDTAERTPEAPARGWSGWYLRSGALGDGGGTRPTLRARSVSCRALPGLVPDCRLSANKGEITGPFP